MKNGNELSELGILTLIKHLEEAGCPCRRKWRRESSSKQF